MCQFVSHFLSYISVKYYSTWFTVGKVVTRIARVNFLLRHSVFTEIMIFCVICAIGELQW